ncbi:beta-amyrin 11-oxidase-like [Carica papaya]|uniref:beta-amyrin 11-oxidase-like n=1 Tax=Carica papaya TaxID=3649 RepID=UPI000B8C7B04|nr:beta-amyrin 11-oxidase-like [Carica papaya]
MDLVFLIFGVIVCAYVLVFGIVKRANEWYYVGRLGKKKQLLPPGDMGWPLLGNLRAFIKAFKSQTPDNFIYELVKRYGRTGIYKTYLFGSPSIIVSIPETCRKVLGDDQHFALGYPASTKQLTGKRSFHSVSHAEHKRLRKLTSSPISGHTALSTYIPCMEDIAMTSLDEWASMQRPIEFLNEMRKAAFKVITHIWLGSHDDSTRKLMEKYYIDFSCGLKAVAINIPGFAFHKALKARKKLVEILQGVLDERKRLKNEDWEDRKRGMVDLLLEVEDENSVKLEDEDIIDLLLVFLLAGHESSAHAAMWALIYLHQHPDMLQKAKEEQEEVVKKRPSTQRGLNFDEIRQMRYTSKVIDETLRRTNVSFSNFRQAKEDVTINGYLIPKGWKVLVWNRGVHMDPEVHKNPTEFDPFRWEDYKPKPSSFIPFGGGSRICPGAELAKVEVYIFLHYFLLNYRLDRVNPASPVVYLPIPRPADYCLARIIKLSNNST